MFDKLFKVENGLAIIVAIVGITAVIAGGLATMSGGDPGTCIATVNPSKLPYGGMAGYVTLIPCQDVVQDLSWGSTMDYVDFVIHPVRGRYDNDPCEIYLGYPFGSITC